MKETDARTSVKACCRWLHAVEVVEDVFGPVGPGRLETIVEGRFSRGIFFRAIIFLLS